MKVGVEWGVGVVLGNRSRKCVLGTRLGYYKARSSRRIIRNQSAGLYPYSPGQRTVSISRLA
uniref:Uncharacterized protein n=1 Tax=uncultured alpha proteobacterium HF0130_06E21 TaxID=710808 RepID=E0XT14_9PROT|nr:hypothetical protein [uncultured alpha proteobacterium HF0130_06E21]